MIDHEESAARHGWGSTTVVFQSPQGDIIVAQDVSPGLTLSGEMSPTGRHTGLTLLRRGAVPEGTRGNLKRLPSTHVLGYDYDALRAED